ncbi:uncharacterized protein YkwD [Flavobacterium sp. CG_9.10]|uniref:CAP domain-containing protein n=1 Tax=Flavobacterium sp. CG_9.10 TaxID=2787729 RepID=UPI001A286E09|nr:CAP domain-containing protein [Flavobacterium sp. CG_9.10]MBG6112177.1 uncharacterized protein YkwD [Flavobacterium sp. CG_9.10]
MKLKSLFTLLLISVISTMNSCTSDHYVAPNAPTASVSPVTTPTPVAPTTSTTSLPVATASPLPISDTYSYTYTTAEIQLMDLINAYRVNNGLKSLQKTNYISLKAEEHNNYMITTNILSHDNFSARSQDIMKVLGANAIAENVAYNYSNAQAAFDAWLASPGHKANIVGNFTNFGISIRVSSTDGRKYYTNIFAKI